MQTVIFLTIVFLLAFALSQSGKKRIKKAQPRAKDGKWVKEEAKKEKRIVLVKEGTKIIYYFAI